MVKNLSMKEIKVQDVVQTRLLLIEAQQELQHLRSKAALNDLKNVRQIRQVRKIIARLKTYLNSLT